MNWRFDLALILACTSGSLFYGSSEAFKGSADSLGWGLMALAIVTYLIAYTMAKWVSSRRPDETGV